MKNLTKQEKQFLICLDSDGTVFNSMDIKHKECTIPAIISEWQLHSISSYVTEAAEYVNLYSKYRGINRFQALIKVCDLLPDMYPETRNSISQIDLLRKYVDSMPEFGSNDLISAYERTGDPILKKTLDWSGTVDKLLTENLHKIEPFMNVSESLEKMAEYADIMVVSSESSKILTLEWEQHGLLRFVCTISGREEGAKRRILSLAKTSGYKQDCILMIGDAPGDLEAADSNGILFYPINPGTEYYSWKEFYEEAFDVFIKGYYKGSYQNRLVSKFTKILRYSLK